MDSIDVLYIAHCYALTNVAVPIFAIQSDQVLQKFICILKYNTAALYAV